MTMPRCFYEEEKHIIPLDELKGYCSSPNLRQAALTSITYLTGSRVTEIASLKRGDVRLDNGIIRLSIRTLKRKGRFKDQKRTIPLPIKELKPVITPLLKWLKLRWNTPPDTPLFGIGTRSIQYEVKALTGHGVHCLRHTRLTHLAEKGFTEYELMKYVNWGTPQTASNYIRISEKHIQDRLLEVGL